MKYLHLFFSYIQIEGQNTLFKAEIDRYSLSRREESYNHKLSACLLVCPHFTDWSKKKVKTNGTILHRT